MVVVQKPRTQTFGHCKSDKPFIIDQRTPTLHLIVCEPEPYILRVLLLLLHTHTQEERREMEVPIKFYRGINSYWRRRKYQKLERSSSPGHKKVTKLGAVRGTRRWFVRLRRSFRFRIRLPSPVRLLVRLRDAYVDCMLAMAGKAPGLSTKSGPEVWSKRIPTSRSTKIKSVEFERRLICEIYKSLVISGEL